MALRECPVCGKEVSTNAFKCMYCNAEFEPIQSEKTKVENLESENHNSEVAIVKESKGDQTDYHLISLITIILGCISWGIGIYKILVYKSGELYPYDPINCYVGGDAYNLLINGVYFAGLAVIGGTLIISGILIMIYGKIQQR